MCGAHNEKAFDPDKIVLPRCWNVTGEFMFLKHYTVDSTHSVVNIILADIQCNIFGKKGNSNP